MAACDYCAKQVKEDESTVQCMGFCDGVVHLRCIKMGSQKMNPSFLKIINECSNMFWMCDECVKLMKVARFRTVMGSVGEMLESMEDDQDRKNAELRELITQNGQQLLLLSKRVTSISTTANRSNLPRPNATPKRDRNSNPIPPKPVPSKPLVFGTKAVANVGITCIPPEENLFRLYVSRFANNTTAAQVEALVKNVIGENELVQVKALVKKDVDPLSLPFISFKVGVNMEHKEAISNPAIWPGNCGFREFEDKQRKISSPQNSGDEQPQQPPKKQMLGDGVLPIVITPSGPNNSSTPAPANSDDVFQTPRSGNSETVVDAMEH